MLVLEAGRVVPAGRLVEQVWRSSPPPGAAKTLRSYVSRLRALLNPDATLAARGGGYVLRLGSGPPRAFRTADLELFHAARCRFRYSLWTSCGVL